MRLYVEEWESRFEKDGVQDRVTMRVVGILGFKGHWGECVKHQLGYSS